MRSRFAPVAKGLTFLTLASQPRDSTALYSFRHQSPASGGGATSKPAGTLAPTAFRLAFYSLRWVN